jgi:outer membrane protein assembly factor BamB
MRLAIAGALAALPALAVTGTASAAGRSVTHAAAIAASSPGSQSVAYQEDAAHDGMSADWTFEAPLTKSWTATFSGSVWYPLIVGDKVFVDVANGTGGQPYGTAVEALSRSTGQPVWGPIQIGGTYGFGGLTYDEGHLFALNYNGTLRSFDAATGALAWSVQLPGGGVTSSPTASDGKVYVSGNGTVFAVDEASGDVEWTKPVENGDSSAPAVDSTGVYVSYACEQAYSFAFSGALRWHHSTDCEGGGGRTDVLHKGLDYIRDDAGMAPAALSESSGGLASNYVSTTAPAFDHSTMLTLAAGTITATDLTSGQALWRSAPSHYSVAPLIVNGYVVAGTSSGSVSLLDERTGQVVWTGSAGTTIAAPDEHNAVGVVGLAEAEGTLAVPAGDQLSVFAASDTPKAHITSGPADGGFVRSNATFHFTSNVTDDPTYTCTFDGVSVGCTSPFTASNLSNGPHSFAVTVDGISDTRQTRTFRADLDTPHVRLSAFAQHFDTAPRTTARWSGTDSGSGVKTFDVRSRTITPRGVVSQWHHPLAGVTSTSARLALPQARTLCVSVRARDRVGNMSAWSHERCTAGLVDDRRLTASPGWYAGVSGDDFDQTFTATTRRAATLTLRNVKAGRIAVAVVVCPTCGSIVVSFGSIHERLSLHDSSITGSRLFVLPLGRETKSTLRLRVASTGKSVEVDAVGLKAHPGQRLR